MRVFFDTSALTKRYLYESGSLAVQEMLVKIDQVIVAPTFLTEFAVLIQRRYRHKDLTVEQMRSLKQHMAEDIMSFQIVRWNDDLVEHTVDLAEKYPLATLDIIQLASACSIAPDKFVTSDKQLYAYARQEIKSAVFI
ncbi:MAG: type II toxin-antitoxin system VapC family toxin [Candidatus Omnitrophica bacterium]|nr:type II toxin-antitoxin system VapC family toxin [Candidatus Omnitrophota bacterium]